jgi:hypothetical protein
MDYRRKTRKDTVVTTSVLSSDITGIKAKGGGAVPVIC